MKHEKPLDRHDERQSRLAQLLLDGRIAAGLMQTEAAQRIGVSPTYLGRLERGEYSNPSPRILAAAAEVYKLSQADLFAAAGYLSPSELPTLTSYLRTTCAGLPNSAIGEMVHYCEYIQARYKDKHGKIGENPEEES